MAATLYWEPSAVTPKIDSKTQQPVGFLVERIKSRYVFLSVLLCGISILLENEGFMPGNHLVDVVTHNFIN